MPLSRVVFFAAACASLCSAATLSPEAKYRDCSDSGNPSSVGYVTGMDTSYTAGWAQNPSKSALLNASVVMVDGGNATVIMDALKAACDGLLADNQIGEIYKITKDPNCTTCMRMAIYNSSAGMNAGRVGDMGQRWVCTKTSMEAPMRDCPTRLTATSKYRDCSASGNPMSVGYVTGMDTSYTAGWAQNPSKSALLNASMVMVAGENATATTMALQAACDGLLNEGQVGEIYEITKDPNCTNCVRMAIYDSSVGVNSGRLMEPEGTKKWVCQKSAPPMEVPLRSCMSVLSGTSKYRDCSDSGNPMSVGYVTGMDTSYTASWAQNPSKSALLNASMVQVAGGDVEATTMALQAACDGLLNEDQVGEIYQINKDPNCTNCMRMAIYGSSVGVNSGRVMEPEGSTKWVCQKKAPPMETPLRNCMAVLSAESKYRDCSESGNVMSVGYVTGMDTSYTSGWAQNPSKSALLNASVVQVAGENAEVTTMALQAACDALLTENQLGEIYQMTNDPNCTNCMRMAIYGTSEGVNAGRVPEEGAKKWTCQKSAPPMAAPLRDCPPTPAPTEAPTEAPTPAPPAVVQVTYTLTNLNYTAASANATLKNSIIHAVKEGVLASLTGYTKDDLVVTLSSGSIVADVTIAPKGDTTASALKTTVISAESAMQTSVSTKVTAVEGLDQALDSGKTLSEVSVSSVVAGTPAPSPVDTSDAASLLSHLRAFPIMVSATLMAVNQ